VIHIGLMLPRMAFPKHLTVRLNPDRGPGVFAAHES
jgi:hypothetical protein